MYDEHTSRRKYLATVCVVGAAGLAGCSDQGTEAPSETGQDSAGETTVLSCEEPAVRNDVIDDDQVHPAYEKTVVAVQSTDCEVTGSVTAAVADTRDLRYTGLSDTASLPADRGMLFVYGDEQDSLTYVMREMDFGIDIVYADSEGVVTSIHHADAPAPDEDGNDQEYDGYGQYVLEVNYGWTTDHGVEAGDRLVFELP